MKTLIRDVLAIFTRKPQGPVVVRHNLTDEEKAALQPCRWAGFPPLKNWSAKPPAWPVKPELPPT